MTEFHTDALRPSSLPTASLGRRQFPTTGSGANGNGNDTSTEDAELDKTAEEWNLRIDKEMKNMTVGLGELVDLADITTNPSPDKSQINALHLKLKTSQLIRSAQSIRDISHELKLMLLLSDQGDEVKERDKEAGEVRREVERGRRELGERVSGMLAGPQPQAQPRTGAGAGGADGVDGRDVDDREGEGKGERMEVDPLSGRTDGEPRTSVNDQEEEEDEEDEGFEQVA